MLRLCREEHGEQCVCVRVVYTARCVVACIDRVLRVPTNFVYARRTIHTQTRDSRATVDRRDARRTDATANTAHRVALRGRGTNDRSRCRGTSSTPPLPAKDKLFASKSAYPVHEHAYLTCSRRVERSRFLERISSVCSMPLRPRFCASSDCSSLADGCCRRGAALLEVLQLRPKLARPPPLRAPHLVACFRSHAGLVGGGVSACVRRTRRCRRRCHHRPELRARPRH